MKNSLRKFLATASIATLGIAGFANVVKAQLNPDVTATANIPASCNVDYKLIEDFTGDGLDGNDLDAIVSLDYTCNTASVVVTEESAYTYSGIVTQADIENYVRVTTESFIDGNLDLAPDSVGTVFGSDTITNSNTPGVAVPNATAALKVTTNGGADVIPAGTYTVTKTVTVTPN